MTSRSEPKTKTYQLNPQEPDSLPALSVILSQYGMVGSGRQYGGSMDEFLSSIPAETLHTLRAHILNGEEEKALLMACNYVVKFYTYIPMNICLSHGDFVYKLLQLARQS
jgi:hypothetical protein